MSSDENKDATTFPEDVPLVSVGKQKGLLSTDLFFMSGKSRVAAEEYRSRTWPRPLPTLKLLTIHPQEVGVVYLFVTDRGELNNRPVTDRVVKRYKVVFFDLERTTLELRATGSTTLFEGRDREVFQIIDGQHRLSAVKAKGLPR